MKLLFWRESDGERVVGQVLGRSAQRNKVDAIQLMAESLRQAYGDTIDAREGLRDARDVLETSRVSGVAADIRVAEAALRNAEECLRNRETDLRIVERRAQSRFPDYFKNF